MGTASFKVGSVILAAILLAFYALANDEFGLQRELLFHQHTLLDYIQKVRRINRTYVSPPI